MSGSYHLVGTCSRCEKRVYDWMEPWRVMSSDGWLLVCAGCANQEPGGAVKKHGEHLRGVRRTRDWRK